MKRGPSSEKVKNILLFVLYKLGMNMRAALIRASSSARSGAHGGPSALLSAAVRSSGWQADAAQEETAAMLERVWQQRVRRHGQEQSLQGFSETISGVYLHGEVGSGKTALMDMLVQAGAAAGMRVRRMHFHELMQQVHSEMHRKRRAPPEIGMALGREASDLFCLDEMQITDIADAAIVSRVLGGILQAGASLVATSNRPPAELYKGGLNRHVYIPQLVTTLRTHGVVTHELVAQGGDYREVRARASSAAASSNTAAAMCPEHGLTNVSGTDASDATARASLRTVRFHVSSDGVSSSLRSALERRGEGCDAPGDALGPRPPLELGGGRRLRLESANDAACVLSFSELCEVPVGAADYLALADRFEALGLEGVPALDDNRHNAARRLISFIDVWYDRGRELHMAAEVPLERLFEGLGGSAAELEAELGPSHAPSAVNMRGTGGASAGLSSTWLQDGTEWSATGRLGVSLAGLQGLQDAAFARRRAVSRLREMCYSDAWPPQPSSTTRTSADDLRNEVRGSP